MRIHQSAAVRSCDSASFPSPRAAGRRDRHAPSPACTAAFQCVSGVRSAALAASFGASAGQARLHESALQPGKLASTKACAEARLSLAVIPAKAGVQCLGLDASLSRGCGEPRVPRASASLIAVMPAKAGIQCLGLDASLSLGCVEPRVPLASAASGLLSFVSSKESNQRKDDPAVAPVGLRPPGSLRCSPATGRRTTRPSMASNSSPFPGV